MYHIFIQSTTYYKVRCDFKTTLTPLCHPYQIAETSILDSRKEILTKMQLPRTIITSKLEKCLKITHLPTSSKKSDKKGKIAIRIFFPFQQNFPLLPCPLFGNCISLSIVSAESQQSKYKHIRTYSFLQLSQGQVGKQQCRFGYLLEKVFRNSVLRNHQFQFSNRPLLILIQSSAHVQWSLRIAFV